MPEPTALDALTNAVDDLTNAIDEFMTIAGPAKSGHAHELPTAAAVSMIATIHQVQISAAAVVDGLLLAVRDPDRHDRPSLRMLGLRLGLHHTTIDERIRRAAAEANPEPPVHAHTYGMACPVNGCRWPMDDPSARPTELERARIERGETL